MFLGFCRKSANKAHCHWFAHLSIFILRIKLIINSPLLISFCRWLSAEMLFFLKKQRKHLMMPLISSQTFSTTRFSFPLNFICTLLFFIQYLWSVRRKTHLRWMSLKVHIVISILYSSESNAKSFSSALCLAQFLFCVHKCRTLFLEKTF